MTTYAKNIHTKNGFGLFQWSKYVSTYASLHFFHTVWHQTDRHLCILHFQCSMHLNMHSPFNEANMGGGGPNIKVWLWNLMNRKKLTVSNTMWVGTECNNHLWWWWWRLCTFEFHNRNISMMTVFCVEDLTASIFRVMVIQAPSYSEMLVHIPEGSHLHSCQNENIKAQLENFCNI
jgi:hypothetical protein